MATQTFHLRGLDPKARYEITDLDIGKSETRSGKELMETGLIVQIKEMPGSALIVYKRAK